MSSELKRRTFTALTWSALEVACRQGIQFFVAIALARLLTPEEFGTIAMLFLFTAVAGSFVDAGFSAALIQKQDVTEEETTAVFYFNLAMGLVTALALGGAAPWIARFYAQPILQPLTWVMALNLVLGALGAVHRALLTKEMDFRTQTRISGVATLLSGGVAVVLAWRGWGVWSLAVQIVLASAVSTALLWWWRPWRPRAPFRPRALRPLFRFGSFLFLSGLLNTAYERLYTLLIGKLYSPADLGQYSRADHTRNVPASLLSTVVSRVAFPMFSSVAQDPELLRRGLRRAITHTMLINLPVSLGLLAVAEPLVLTLFGPVWLPCVPLLRILCLAGVLWPLHVLNLNCLMALGRSDLFFRLELWKKGLGIAAIALAANFSVRAMAWAQVIMAAVSFLLNAYYTGRFLGYGAWRQVKDFAAPAVAAGVMLGGVMALGRLETGPAAVRLAVQILAGAALYAALCHLGKIPAFGEIRAQLATLLVARRPTPV